MSLVNKAVWFIETHYAEDITLDDVARGVGVSRFHLVRAFGLGTGYTVMRYVRARRLSIAAQALAKRDVTNILDVALEAGYGSHEAFTRAFREQFGITPETIRTNGLSDIQLVEALYMSQENSQPITPPQLETHEAFLVVGVRERYGEEASQHIPAQWQRFASYVDSIPAQVGNSTYGVGYNGDDEGNIDYICGIEVTNFADLPQGLDHVRIPEHRYLVFKHPEHVASVSKTWNAIWNAWMPQSEYQVADAPFFEKYGDNFDPKTGFGDIELWVPVK